MVKSTSCFKWLFVAGLFLLASPMLPAGKSLNLQVVTSPGLWPMLN